MDTFDLKHLDDRLMNNIKNIGEGQGDKKQASLMFNIWKNCLEQRLLDETLFTLLFSGFLLKSIYDLTSSHNYFKDMQLNFFGDIVLDQMYMLAQAPPEIAMPLCNIKVN